MPDVVVKGMDMPKGCMDCVMRYNGWVCRQMGRLLTIEDIMAAEDKRPDWCPLEPAPEWISWDERLLPEDNQRILIYVDCKGHEPIQLDTAMDDGETFGLESGYGFGKGESTHWMPLPEPPGGDNDGTA